MVDFAGSGVVHLTGGATALIATKIVGPRKGRFYDDAGVKLENPVPFPGHSKPLQMLGTLILWFGWYGFNAGSAIDPTSSQFNTRAVSTAVVNTTLAGAAGGVSALFMNYFLEERKTGEPVYNLLYGMNGSIAGLVSITAGCAVVQPWAALVIGIIAGWIYLGSSFIMEKYCIDDAVDAIPVHFANGIWGCIAVGLFASPRGLLNLTDNAVHYGLFYSWGQGSSDARLLACQIIGVIFIMSWITVIMTPFFFILNYSGWLRADSLEEFVGLDVSYHGSTDFQGVDPEYVSIMNRRRDARRSRHSLHSGDVDKVEDGGVDVIQ
jgi:Amt family ammonium transporter